MLSDRQLVLYCALVLFHCLVKPFWFYDFSCHSSMWKNTWVLAGFLYLWQHSWRQTEKGWHAAKGWSRTPGRCSNDSAFIHGAPALPFKEGSDKKSHRQILLFCRDILEKHGFHSKTSLCLEMSSNKYHFYSSKPVIDWVPLHRTIWICPFTAVAMEEWFAVNIHQSSAKHPSIHTND